MEKPIEEMTEEEFNKFLRINAARLWGPDDYIIITRNGTHVNYAKYPPNDTNS